MMSRFLARLALAFSAALGCRAQSDDVPPAPQAQAAPAPEAVMTATPVSPLVVGAVAPDFTAEAHDGTTITLRSLRGKPVVLYFYPKDETPG